jgi:hypothetical protein
MFMGMSVNQTTTAPLQPEKHSPQQVSPAHWERGTMQQPPSQPEILQGIREAKWLRKKEEQITSLLIKSELDYKDTPPFPFSRLSIPSTLQRPH